VMFDTSVYSHLAITHRALRQKIFDSDNLKIYGCDVVRKELRQTPPGKKVWTRKLRILMLNDYDVLIGRHGAMAGDLASYLATEYSKEYGGKAPEGKMRNDFLIVAAASLKGIEHICTEDFSTMASGDAIKSYAAVNERNGVKTPKFVSLAGLDAML